MHPSVQRCRLHRQGVSHHQTQPETGAGWQSADALTTARCPAASRPARWSTACCSSVAPVMFACAAHALRGQHRLTADSAAPVIHRGEVSAASNELQAKGRATRPQQVRLLALLSGRLMVARCQPRSRPLLLGQQGATTRHTLKQVQGGCWQMPLAASKQQDGHLLGTTLLALGVASLPSQEQTPAPGPAGSHHQTQPEAGAGWLLANASGSVMT